MVEHDKQAMQGDFYSLVVLSAEQVDVVADDVAFLVEAEDECGVAGVGKVGEDVADLPAHVVGIGLEEPEDFLEERLAGEDGLRLALRAG